MQGDTIAAIATAVGVGGIGIVRISGKEALAVADRVFRSKSGMKVSEQPSYSARYGEVIDSESGEVIDEALALVMRAPRSYTREDVVELHCHGGPLPLSLVLQTVVKAGARVAEPGEFTQRAFFNGRIDLAQAEAVCDVIRAQTETSLRLAQGQLRGLLSQTAKSLTARLLELEAWREVGIDLPEDDIPELRNEELVVRLQSIEKEITQLLARGQSGRVLREGLPAVIVGKPNAGKSSLMNALTGTERALVTDIPGT
ncbi:MAG: tRNA uridine-5-carboxymethylaminomethyl(34) synthesis GTPase MnmE, partial [Firmicutes bacterium]|nr:tRNA uridine-5-carboxymethylaminomethyl(34) synthesis GTPase MnmE [Bacillota bacterium]